LGESKGFIESAREGQPWALVEVNGRAFSPEQDCKHPSPGVMAKWRDANYQRVLSDGSIETMQSVRFAFRGLRPPPPPPLRNTVEGDPDCVNKVRRLADAFFPGFPPLPAPTVEDEEVPFTYVNFLNGYRDTVYILLQGDTGTQLNSYRALTAVDRPGAEQGINRATSAWGGVAARVRATVPHRLGCEVVFAWTWQGRHYSNVLTMRQYVMMMLDYKIVLAWSQMQGFPRTGLGILPDMPDQAVLPCYLLRVYVLALHGDLGEYRPARYINYFPTGADEDYCRLD
jgi:hypothetical protein